MGKSHQFLTAFLCNLGGFHVGALVGWLSPAIPQILSAEKPLGDVTMEQSSWLASLYALPGILAPLTSHWSNKYGRKKCVMASTIPYVLFGLSCFFAKDITLILVGRLVSGIGLTLYLCNGSIYTAEISDVDCRGKMASLFNLLYTFGLACVYAFGGFISYKASGLMMATVGILNFIGLIFMPETPAYLLKNSRTDEAIETIAWLKETPADSLIVKQEIERLQNTSSSGQLSNMEAIKLLFTSKPLFYGFFLCTVMFLGQIYCGMVVMHGYAVTLFTGGGAPKLSPTQASLIYATVQIFGALSTTSLVERVGRKILLLFSFSSICLSMAVMGTYFHLVSKNFDLEGYRWVPLVTLCYCVYAYTVGASGIPFVLLVDLLSPEVKIVATMIVVQILTVNAFILFRIYEPLSVMFGRHNVFYLFSCCSLAITIFIIVFITETKGKVNEDIIDMNYGFKNKFKLKNDKNSKSTVVNY